MIHEINIYLPTLLLHLPGNPYQLDISSIKDINRKNVKSFDVKRIMKLFKWAPWGRAILIIMKLLKVTQIRNSYLLIDLRGNPCSKS